MAMKAFFNIVVSTVVEDDSEESSDLAAKKLRENWPDLKGFTLEQVDFDDLEPDEESEELASDDNA